MSNSYIWPIDWTLSGATTPESKWARNVGWLVGWVLWHIKIRPGSDGNERVLRILQSFSITGASPLECFVLYSGHTLEEGLTPLQRCSHCILQSPPRPTGLRRLGEFLNFVIALNTSKKSVFFPVQKLNFEIFQILYAQESWVMVIFERLFFLMRETAGEARTNL